MNWLHFLFNILRNRQGYLIVGIVSVDLLTKILAYNFLDANEIINDDALLQTVLALNSNGLGSSGEAYVVKYGSDSLLTNAMIFLLFSLAVPILACIGKLTVWRLLLATVVVVTMSYILISLIKPNLGFQQKVLAIRVSHIFIWFTIWVYS
ncbi:MAG: hypothetical protein OEW08_15255, partial [Gammaproteobacteria bacterium]|nr:hypothetical protein [Gammaproteobacteria bacterium]